MDELVYLLLQTSLEAGWKLLSYMPKVERVHRSGKARLVVPDHLIVSLDAIQMRNDNKHSKGCISSSGRSAFAGHTSRSEMGFSV